MEKIKLLLYCTKSKPYLVKEAFNGYMTKNNLGVLEEEKERFILNGKIVAECDFEVEEIIAHEYRDYYSTSINHIGDEELKKRSCLELNQLIDYLGVKEWGSYELIKKVGYAIHLKNLHIFDKPRELKECWKNTNAWIFSNEKLYSAPQNMRYCGDWNLKKAILISIRPEWLCKILNGEKTIEVRKKVLKEMLEYGK